MVERITYRGDILPNVATLTDAQIAERIRHAAALDREICRVLRRYRAKHDDEAARAAVDVLQAWADVGLASIAAAENRREVSIFTRTRSV